MVASSPLVVRLVVGSRLVVASVEHSPLAAGSRLVVASVEHNPLAVGSLLVAASVEHNLLAADSRLAVTWVTDILFNVNLPFGMQAAFRIKRSQHSLEEQHILEVAQKQ